jgi:serine/tyrosine/threonine adenylyltransferase
MIAFESRFVDRLPGDRDTRNFCRQVSGACYSFVEPTPVVEPTIVAYSADVTELLGLEADWMDTKQAAAVLGGNALLPGMKPYAACYGGHQFGNWAGQLGDGRAINLGETVSPSGDLWVMQLKGAGRTPYSRSGDGLAVLRSSVREFLCSEAMHYLGVPTTRALSLVLTGELVTRDMFYDGRPRKEPGAIVCRVAPSFTRFGNFEILTERGEIENLRKLVDFTIATDFPHLDPSGPDVVSDWFSEVCTRTAEMVVHWMRVGFVHGVMNTDNMSILGQTIDYGPYGWLEGYEPSWTPNTTDSAHHRYAFGNQPQIAHWNLLQLANALWPLIEDEGPLQAGLNRYVDVYKSSYNQMMASKLGLRHFDETADGPLLEQLDVVLQATETDMTLFYRQLSMIQLDEVEMDNVHAFVTPDWAVSLLSEAYYDSTNLGQEMLDLTTSWLQRYVRRLIQDRRSDADRSSSMNAVNPLYVLRNYLAQQAIDLAEKGDYAEISRLLKLLKSPYGIQPGVSAYASKRPEWARHKAGCSMLSCSS